MKINYQNGQTLIETLAALAIAGMVISAIGVVVTTSLSIATYNQNQTLATKYAQQGSEIVQQIRDGSYTAFQAYNTPINQYYCLGKGQTTLNTAQSDCSTDKVDNFIRTVEVQQGGCGAGVAQVTVTVSFTDGKCVNGLYCHKQTVQTCLSTIDPIQAP